MIKKPANHLPVGIAGKWQSVRLGDHASKIGSGFTPLGGHASYQRSGIPLIRSQNVHMMQFESNGLAYISAHQDSLMATSRVHARDVLLNITGASIGRVCVAPAEVCPANVNQHVCVIRCVSSLDADFLAFFLATPEFQNHINGAQAGATRQALTKSLIEEFRVPLVDVTEQRRIASRLREELAAVAQARAALEAQLAAAEALPDACVREDAFDAETTHQPIREVIREVTKGIGEAWRNQPVLGATRAGLAPAKEGVGKHPGRYKPVTPGTVFYNPMRILLGSIALVDEGDTPGITSPDYVVMRGREGVLHPVWFYQWFRSSAGAGFIKSLTRGAVRERLLFNRVAPGLVPVPSWPRQLATVERIRAATKLRTALAAKLAEVEKLPAALLRAAFSNAEKQG